MCSARAATPAPQASNAVFELATMCSREQPSVGDCEPPLRTEVKVRSKIKLFAILLALYSTLFISALNSTIVATSIPTICYELNSSSGYAWIGGAYLLALAAAVPVWAKLSDIWGRTLILLAAVALYFVASIICAASNSMAMLIAGRGFQGIAGGGMTQLVSIVISDLFSLRKRALYFGFQQAIWVVAGGIGPVLGGTFAQHATWRWSFWINLPISGIGFALLFIFLDVHNPKTKLIDGIKAVDWIGILSIVAFTVMLLLGLNFGGVTFPWPSAKVICLIVFGVILLVFFVFSEIRLARFPVMPMSLFRSRSNAACLLVGFVHYSVVISTEFYLPLYFQSVKQMSPVHSGLLILPITITEAIVGVLSGIIIHRTGRYIEIIWIGILFLTLGVGLYIRFNTISTIAGIVACEIVAGIGAGLLFEPPIIALQASVIQADTATATATLGFLRNVSTSLAVVVGGILFQNGMHLREPNLRQAGLPSEVIQLLSGGSAAANVNIVRKITDEGQKMAVLDAFARSLRNVWLLCTCLAACGVLASGFITRQELKNEHVEARPGIKS